MLEVIFLVVLGLIWIGFAAVGDLKSHEVPDWLSFSLIIFALGFRFFYCLLAPESRGFSFFYQGLIGFGIFFALGNALYYGKMFGGGDAKLMYAMGAIIPFSTSFMTNLSIFVIFIILFLFSGAAYGLVTSTFIGLRKVKNLRKELSKVFRQKKKLVYSLILMGIVFLVLGFVESMFFWFGLLFFVTPYLFVYAKAIDNGLMVRDVLASKLREGDWLYKDIKIGKKLIKAKWEGLNKEEIKLIRLKMNSVLIKHGIAFVPVFFLAFVALVCLWFLKPELFDLSLWNGLLF